ncbi:NADH dehydrogenase subunit L [Thiomicrorhabdus immobilis]|uniref:Probable inorganic carbon transporter subunit DabB n=1 Tax=Thiomicrorhabdus immobilis TaxID=2791037 RepID=A0ABN6CZ41_9GAMM|nr:NADH-quinone oxidoreductase subunit L [Thiomicrorhabdus immobilis]BCN94381.1 NADH dehydrogenase subunit L [Thiomicrorhabdus immobilis]
MNTPMIWSLSLYAIPLLFLMGAAANLSHVNWRATLWASQGALWIAAASALLTLFGNVPLADLQGAGWINPSASSLVMLLLISFIAFVNVRFSHNYMAGNREEETRYLRWLMLTLGSVTLVVISNHLLVFMAAWISISMSLHQLLVFYPQRQRAVLAAYKKFIFARLAEVTLFTAIMLLYYDTGSWLISDVYVAMAKASQLNGVQETAAVLLALTALIKCAQLPLHGWLIQVVEAPTPVSALLHAGIINLGGFLMILFAPLIIQSAIAQWLLLIVGGLTTVVAALIMMTKISVKVRLAWSTMSQMGLMLVECGLGLYELALLHLVAHSCYKAYAFLNSGSEVESDLKRRLALPKMPRAPQWLSSFLIAAAFVAGMIWIFDISGPYSPWLLLGIAMMILVAERDSRLQRGGLFGVLSMALILVAAYSLQKYGAGLVVQSLPDAVGVWGDLWMSVLFIGFIALYWVLKYWPEHPKVMHFRVALYAGFYLDEWVTRLSLNLFPKQLPVRFNPKQLQIAPREMIQ